MRFIFKFFGFVLLQFVGFGLLMNATQGGTGEILFLSLGSIVSLLSYYVLFKRSKK